MMEGRMRLALFVVFMLAGLSTDAKAGRDYPWCLFGGQLGYSGECMYETREQCLASASGRWNTYCDINPRVRYGQQAPRRTTCDSQGRRCTTKP
ncbi:DUF3551 domain-containing protein [Bradyrhizobium cajani]|uniref:DUF3551 domain-containing protein n=2 Tax=Bradyrhizobium cajani TaxID=1928661 RepID=A0A844TD99_9BRAD|nr:DUF3551 domain-containing protein [Bradyrhizobium cajani]MVT77018.1 DUF3551 domain-containing protein [Bradyrhizobium cajani]